MKKGNIKQEEFDILELWIRGISEISEQANITGLSESNIKVIRHRLFKKLRVGNMKEAVQLIARGGDRVFETFHPHQVTPKEYAQISDEICRYVSSFYRQREGRRNKTDRYASMENIIEEFEDVDIGIIRRSLRDWEKRGYIQPLVVERETRFKPLASP